VNDSRSKRASIGMRMGKAKDDLNEALVEYLVEK
jgi:hypothetical protein